FSGSNFTRDNFPQINEQFLHHQRTDLGINYLISLYHMLGFYYAMPVYSQQQTGALPNPTEWLRASDFIVDALLTPCSPEMISFADTQEKVLILYNDALLLSNSIAMLANHTNIRFLMDNFKKYLPKLLSGCLNCIDSQIANQLKNSKL